MGVCLRPNHHVLILVLMEDTLREFYVQETIGGWRS